REALRNPLPYLIPETPYPEKIEEVLSKLHNVLGRRDLLCPIHGGKQIEPFAVHDVVVSPELLSIPEKVINNPSLSILLVLSKVAALWMRVSPLKLCHPNTPLQSASSDREDDSDLLQDHR